LNLMTACFDKSRMRVMFFLAVFSVLPTVGLLAQLPEVSGLVRDGENRPVANATVSLLNAGDSLVRAFAKTDAQGAFAIKPAGVGAFLVSVAKMGFRTEYRPLRTDDRHLLFTLQKDTVYRIEEVVVTRKKKIRVDGDTVSYALDAFRTGGERTLEEVLAKLPGFEIKEDGRISVNGRSIQKILVEGDDIVNRQYKQLSQNLSPDIVKDVQVIDNYLDDPFFKTSSRTDDIALNLKLKEDFKNTLVTTMDIGGGTVERYSAGMNNLLLSRRAKLYTLTSANNIGEDISAKPMEYTPKTALVSAYRPEVPEATLIDIGIGQPPRMERKRWFDNNSSMFAVNLVPSLGTRTKTRLNSGLSYAKSRQERATNREYFLPGGDNILFGETISRRGKMLAFSNDFRLEHLLAPNQRIRYELEADVLKETNANRTLSGMDSISEHLRSDGHSVRNSLNYVNRFRNGTFLSLDLCQISSRVPQDYRISGYDYAAVFQDSAVADARQELDVPGRFFGARATYYFEMNGLQMVGRGGHERTRDRLYSLFAPTDRTDLPGAGIANDLIYLTERSYAELETVKKLSRRLELRALIGLDGRIGRKETPYGTEKIRGFHFIPDAKLSYRLARRSKIILGFRKSIGHHPVTALYGKPVFTGYRYAGNHADGLYFKPAESYTLAYRFNDAFTQFSAHASLMYTASRNGFFSENRISEGMDLSTRKRRTEGRERERERERA